MKYLKNGEFGKNDMLRLVLVLAMIYISIFWITNLLIYAEKIGFTYSSVAGYYAGSEDEFKNPISYAGLLESTHFHLFSYGVALLVVGHLAVYSGVLTFAMRFLIPVSFLAGLLNIGAGWMIRFISPSFTWLKIGSFIVFQAGFFILLCCSFAAVKMYRAGQR